MNRRTIVSVLAILAIGMLAFGVTRYMTRHGARGRPAVSLDCLQDTSFLTRQLSLSEAQAREVQAMHAVLAAKLDECCARHCAARARLAEALAGETNTSAQADAAMADMCRAYEDSERATLDHMRQMRAVLNTQQRRRFDAMMADCLCRTCAMHGSGMRSCGGRFISGPCRARPWAI